MSTSPSLHEDSQGAPALPEKAQLPTAPQRWQFLRKPKVLVAIAAVLIIAIALALGLGLHYGLSKSPPPPRKGPNVLVVMSDDQDVLLDSMSVMPKVASLLGQQGTTFEKHYCTIAWCCPSRVNFFTGRAAHNTNVTSLAPPYGGWPKFTANGLNNNYLPVWLSAAGVRTYYVGKFMNGYEQNLISTPAHPQGWTKSNFLIDPWTYNYYHSKWTNDYTNDISSFDGVHTTNVTQDKALGMIDEAAATGDQFFMMVAPVAPHQEILNGTVLPPPIPKEYQGIYDDRIAPRRANFNPKVPSGASWVRDMPMLGAEGLKICDETYYHRLGNIAAIDEMVSQLVGRLDAHGILNNTYIIYTTDNGFHIGNHRLHPGKRCPYEEDINIPLLIRGPNVPKNVTSTHVNSHTDMAPTIMNMLQLDGSGHQFDGTPIPFANEAMLSSTPTTNRTELVNVEFWNANDPHPGHDKGYNNTYKALRLVSGNYSLFYSTWCTGEREFYDMNADLVQMNNLLGSNATDTGSLYYGRTQSELIPRLDALLMVTKGCKEESCQLPWTVLFPGGQVTELESAMKPEYDAFFANQPKVSFTYCVPGHIVAEEGPQNVLAFKS